MYLVLLGPPGTGKGTQAKRLAQHLGIAHVSSGDMFRDAIAQGTTFGRQAKEYMNRGDLVPDEVTIAMLDERIQQSDARNGALFDGYPRTMEQAQALSRALQERHGSVAAALHVTASDEEIISRLTGRWLCPACGEIYHERHRPPKQAQLCDACGGTLTQRDDDEPDVVRERLRRQRPPGELLAYYRDQGKLVEIDGEQEMDAVTNDLLAAIETVMSAGTARTDVRG